MKRNQSFAMSTSSQRSLTDEFYLGSNGHQLNVEVVSPSGNPESSPVVVLLHHGLGSLRSWSDTTPALVAAGYRVVAYDRWGYGHSDPRQGVGMPYFEDDLKDLQAICGQIGIEPVSLIGHSDGGTIALYYAARFPEQVAAMVVVAAHAYVEQEMESGILGVRPARRQNERFRAGLRRLHGEKTDQVFYNWFDGWRRSENRNWDMRAQLERITSPTLVVQGVEDEHATPQHARDIAAAIPAAELWLAPGARHMLPQDMPEDFNERIISFLASST
jgi:pimeloyl-ACP methyl ester carboxylesterase